MPKKVKLDLPAKEACKILHHQSVKAGDTKYDLTPKQQRMFAAKCRGKYSAADYKRMKSKGELGKKKGDIRNRPLVSESEAVSPRDMVRGVAWGADPGQQIDLFTRSVKFRRREPRDLLNKKSGILPQTKMEDIKERADAIVEAISQFYFGSHRKYAAADPYPPWRKEHVAKNVAGTPADIMQYDANMTHDQQNGLK